MRVLLVEDDEDVALLEWSALSDAGIEAQIASTGRAALRLLRDSSTRFDAVVVDRGLGDVTGDEIAALARTCRPDAAVILATGLPADAPACDALLAKPFSMAKLTAAVASAIHARRARKAPAPRRSTRRKP